MQCPVCKQAVAISIYRPAESKLDINKATGKGYKYLSLQISCLCGQWNEYCLKETTNVEE